MELALQGMDQDNLDLGVLQDTKVTYRVYSRGMGGYIVITRGAPG